MDGIDVCVKAHSLAGPTPQVFVLDHSFPSFVWLGTGAIHGLSVYMPLDLLFDLNQNDSNRHRILLPTSFAVGQIASAQD